MKLETASELLRPGQASELPRSWLFASGLIFSAIVWLLGWYGNTVHSMVAIWERSETFAHGFAIVPISAWLIWRRRHAVAALDLRPRFLALPLLALAGFGWLLGQLAGAGVVQQYALVIMIPLLVWAILGNEVVRALFFPLFFLLLAVPFGEFLLPAMIEHTADFTVFALKLSGIPVYREGAFITIPSGNWSVVEACSGLRMLVTFFAFSTAAVFLMDRHWLVKRLVLASAVPIALLTNILRITATGLAHVWLADGDGKTKLLDFIHDFNGWMMMPVGLLFLVLELWLFRHLLIERPAAGVPPLARPKAATATTSKPRFVSVIQMPVGR